MIGKWFLPLPFIFANKNYTLTINEYSYQPVILFVYFLYYLLILIVVLWGDLLELRITWKKNQNGTK